MHQYDFVIIGSGLGGLLCGYILSKEGFSICIVEKNNQIGGCLQTFERNGVRFDTGVHYIGALEPGQTLHRFFSYFGLNGKIALKKLDQNGFDRICLNDEEFVFANGKENFVENLSQKFPNERKNIEKYISKIYEISDHSNLYNLRSSYLNSLLDYEYVRTSVGDFINSFTTDEKLRNVLAATNSLYAGIPDLSPAYIHALINSHYIDSAWRFIKGGSQIAEILSKSITGAGGIILKNSEVISFGFNNKNLNYINLKNCEVINGNNFISNIHPARTLEMIEPGNIRRAYRERIIHLQNTTGAFVVNIVFKKNTFKYLNYNYYYFNSLTIWNTKYNPTNWPEFFILFVPASSHDQQYADHAILFTYMDFREVKRWEKTTIEHRGIDYLDFKEYKAQKLIETAEKAIPGFKSKICNYYTTTPLTYRDYTGTSHGSIYGVLRECVTPEKSFLLPRTRIPNLFFTGQNINSHGILGVTISSILTCSEILGFENLITKIKNAN